MLDRKAGDWRNTIPSFAQSDECFVQSEAERTHDPGPDNGHAGRGWRMIWWRIFRHFSGARHGRDSICFHRQKPLLITPKRKRKLGALVDCQLSFSVAI
jgi:hypothetical protein